MTFGGAPVGRRYIWWNFVSSSQDRIEAAKADWAAHRFGEIPTDHATRVELPSADPVPVRADPLNFSRWRPARGRQCEKLTDPAASEAGEEGGGGDRAGWGAVGDGVVGGLLQHRVDRAPGRRAAG